MKITNGVPATVDKYVATFPRDVQDILKQVLDSIKKAAPDAEETIKYRVPTFVLNENFVHFASLQNHIGFYRTPSGIKEFKRELAEYKFAKGFVQFPIDKPMPLSLVEKFVKFRVNEVKRNSAVNKGNKYLQHDPMRKPCSITSHNTPLKPPTGRGAAFLCGTCHWA